MCRYKVKSLQQTPKRRRMKRMRMKMMMRRMRTKKTWRSR